VYPDEEYRKQVSERIMSDIASRDPQRMVWRDVRITRQSGEIAYVDAVNIPIYEQNFMISTVIDVSERHRASSALAESEARYRAVTRDLPNGMHATPVSDGEHIHHGLSQTQDITASQIVRHEYRRVVEKLNLAIEAAELGVWSRDIATERLEWNDELLRIYGLSRAEFEANPDAWRMVHPDDLAYAAGQLGKIRKGERVRDVRFRIRRRDGEIRHLTASGVPVVCDGSITTLIGVTVDITDTVERERQLSDALARLETAVREANHRIKNNLLTVLSLIDLAENSDHSLSNVTKQINAFVAVHDALGQTEHPGRVEIRSLLHEVAEPHMDALAEMGGRLTIESAEHVVDSKQAVPMVLIVNELVSNAIRHGVRPGAHDFVRICVSSTGDEMRLAVTNSGARLPEEGPDSGNGSIGWTLIRALADQVGACISVECTPHTSIVVTVPVT
jgi:PAS domain S-box-containing protein